MQEISLHSEVVINIHLESLLSEFAIQSHECPIIYLWKHRYLKRTALITELIENYFPFQGGWRGEGDMPVHTTVDTIQRGI